MKLLDNLLAEELIKIHAVLFQPESPFMWASGWSAPLYADIRQTLSYPRVRNLIKVEMARLIMENFADTEVIAGVATGAIAQGALVADSLGKPFVYVRSTPKDHGLENVIEGNIKPGQNVVLIEDQLSTGNNCFKAYHSITQAGGNVVGLMVMFNYQFAQGAQVIESLQVPMVTLTNFEATLQAAKRLGALSPAAIETLRQWHDNPDSWLPAQPAVD